MKKIRQYILKGKEICIGLEDSIVSLDKLHGGIYTIKVTCGAKGQTICVDRFAARLK